MVEISEIKLLEAKGNIRRSQQTRRLSIAVFLLIVVGLKYGLGISLSTGLIFVLAAWFLPTLPFSWLVNRQTQASHVNTLNFRFFFIDLVFMSAAIHYIGGIGWIGMVFYTITILYAGSMLNMTGRMTIATSTFGALTAVSLLEYYQVLDHHSVFPTLNSNAHLDTYYVTTSLVCAAGLFYLLSYTIGEFSDMHRRRGQELSAVKATENEIRLLKEFNEMTLTNAPIGICRVNAGGYINFVNPKAIEVLGLPASVLSDSDNVMLTELPNIHTIAKQHGINFDESGGIQSLIGSLPHEGHSFITKISSQGNEYEVNVGMKPLFDADGKPEGIITLIEDVTEARRLQDQLKETLEKLKASHEALSTPVVQIWDKVLVLPLIGYVDDQRAQKIMQSIMSRIMETQAEMVILDITGVDSVNSAVANHLIKTIQAIKLLGAECLITGIKPETAQTMIHLGLDIESFPSRKNLMDGLMYSLKNLGYEVKREVQFKPAKLVAASKLASGSDQRADL